MLNEDQIRSIASIFNAVEIKNYIEKNKKEFYLFVEYESNTVKQNNIINIHSKLIEGGVE